MEKLFVLTLFMLLISFNRMYAINAGPDYLGLWSIVEVDLSDTGSNEVVCTIPIPPEGIGPFMYNGRYEDGYDIQGPGQPYLFNEQGSTVEIHFKRKMLQIETSISGFDNMFLELYVNKWVGNAGKYYTYPADNTTRCHYLIKLVNGKGLE